MPRDLLKKDKLERLINMEKETIEHDFNIDNFEPQDDPDIIYNAIMKYLPLKFQKYSLNPLFEEKLYETEKFLSSNENFTLKTYRKSEVFKDISYRCFRKHLGYDRKKIKSLPLYTKTKILGEMNKIEKKARKYASLYTYLITPVFSVATSLYFYKNFKHLIRNKKRFFEIYLTKIPIISGLSTYLILKNIFLVYYIRKPLMDTNEIFADSNYKKEITNSDMKISRIKLATKNKYIANRDEYSKFMKFNYGDEDFNLDKIKKRWYSKLKICSYLLSYKTSLWYLRLSKLEIIVMQKYIESIDLLDLKMKIDFFKRVFLYDLYNKRIENLKLDLNKPSTMFIIQGNFRKNIKLNLSNSSGDNSKLNKELVNLRVYLLKHSANSTEKINIFKKIVYFESMQYISSKISPDLVKLYELNYIYKSIRDRRFKRWIKNYNNILSIIQNEEEMKNFAKFIKTNKNLKLSKKERKLNLPEEFIKPEEFIYIKNMINQTYNPASAIPYITQTIIIGLISQIILLRYLKYLY